LYHTSRSKKYSGRFGDLNWSKKSERYGFIFKIPGDTWDIGNKLGFSNIRISVDQTYRCRLFATQGDPVECQDKKGQWLRNSGDISKNSNQISLYIGRKLWGFLSLGIQYNLFWNENHNNIEVLDINSHSSILENELKENYAEYFLKLYTKL